MSKRHNITAILYDKKGNILSIGKNSYIKTHPMQAKYAAQNDEDYKIYLHAEIHAITLCKTPDKIHKLVVMRFNADGSPAKAKPCNICRRALNDYGITNVEHT